MASLEPCSTFVIDVSEVPRELIALLTLSMVACADGTAPPKDSAAFRTASTLPTASSAAADTCSFIVVSICVPISAICSLQVVTVSFS